MTMSNSGHGYEAGPPTADDLRAVHFTPASMLHPGYTDREVDAFVSRAADELARLADENAQLRQHVQGLEEHVHGLQQQLAEAAARPSPSDQAVGILSTAQLTADEYVAEAEEFSRQMTSEARSQYEEQLAAARDKAGAIIQAAQEAGASIAASVGRGGGGPALPESEQLQEQVAYLKAFGQACRTQLRAYLEALLSDVETEWGRAHPAGLPPVPVGVRPQQLERGVVPATAMSLHSNAVADGHDELAPAGASAASVPAVRVPS